VRQFPFHELETVTRKDVERANRALRMVKGFDHSELAAQISQRLSETLGRTRVQIDFVASTVHSSPPATDLMAWRAFLHHPAGGTRALAVLDSSLADDWLRWALEDDEVRLGAPLNPYDWGAISYVGLEIMQLLGRRKAAPLMLDTTPPLEAAVERFFSRNRALHEFCWIISDRRGAGWFRLYMPPRWIDTYTDACDDPDARLRAWIERPAIRDIRLEFDAIVAHRRVARREVDALERGDIIFAAHHALRDVDLEQTPMAQGVLRHRGHRFAGYICARDRWTFEIEEIATQNDESGMSEENAEATREELLASSEATESLNISALQNARVDVDIRVGSTDMSVAQLARIQTGEILELDRKVGDLVDILVDGQVHGQGELVNVEGALGVRVTSLAR